MDTVIPILFSLLLGSDSFAEILFFDDFSGTQLSSDWVILNEDPAHYNLSGGILDLEATAGDVFSTQNNHENMLLISTPTTGDFRVTVRLQSFVPVSQNFTQFDIVAFDDQDNLVRSIYGHVFGGRNLEFGAEVSSVWTNAVSALDLGSSPFFFRLEKIGNTYTQSYSLDGTTFMQGLSSITYGDGTPNFIGIWAGVDPTESSHALVDYIRVEDASPISDGKFSCDFELGVPAEFSGITTTESVQGYSDHGFSGNFLRNLTSDPPEKTTLTLTNLPPHDFISIGFLLAIIDTWDGEVAESGPDFFNVSLDGVVIFSESFQNAFLGENNYAAPPGVLLVEKLQLGFRDASPNDRESGFSMGNDPIFQEIQHSASTAVIEWYASGAGWDHNGDGGAADESWAIDDVFVTLSSIGDPPTISLSKIDGNTLELFYSGVLQSSDDLTVWTDVSPQPLCPSQFSPPSDRMFYRAREY